MFVGINIDNSSRRIKLYCARGYDSWRMKLSNYLQRPNLAGYASSDGERVVLSRKIGISTRHVPISASATGDIGPGLERGEVVFDAVFPRAFLQSVQQLFSPFIRQPPIKPLQ
jgi:hypothetical protein